MSDQYYINCFLYEAIETLDETDTYLGQLRRWRELENVWVYSYKEVQEVTFAPVVVLENELVRAARELVEAGGRIVQFVVSEAFVVGYVALLSSNESFMEEVHGAVYPYDALDHTPTYYNVFNEELERPGDLAAVWLPKRLGRRLITG